MSKKKDLPWINDVTKAKSRGWEEFYRNRWQHDKVVRSTHGVNCTGGCTWMIHVKDGIVTWEMQGLDYPQDLARTCRPYEPRGCQRGISYSWYLYSPLRVKYPYMRVAPCSTCGRKPRDNHTDLHRRLEAWMVSDPRTSASALAEVHGARAASVEPTGTPSWR